MKRLLLAILVFALGWLSATALRAVAQDGGSKIITITDPQSGLAVAYDCVPIPTQEGPTSVPSTTSPQTPSYTPTTAPLIPTPTATPLPICAGTTTAALNVRTGPGTSNPNITDDGVKVVYPLGQVFAVQGWALDSGGMAWLKTTYKAQVGWVSREYVTLSADCTREFPTMPSAKTAWGVWVGVGANRDELVTFGRTLQAKGITPAATVYGDAATANLLHSEGWLVVWRPYTGLNCPVFTEPPEVNATIAWNDALSHSQGVNFSWLVVCNEPVFPSLNYAVRWILTIVNLAERDRVPRVVPVVWSPGRPELDEVPALANVLHSDQISTCWGANLYPAKTGVGLDVFEEWTTYRLLKYPADLPLCVTEFAAGEGGEPPDFAQYPAFVGRYEGRLLWATAWFDAMDLSPWTNANLRGRLDRLARAF